MALKFKFAAALGLALFTAQAAWARIYYINKGVKYHIGDNRFGRSEDALFLGTYPVVGQIWEQAFTVDRPDVVKVRIEGIWGVDDCAYCKNIISIDDHLMGRLMRENNRQPWDTPEPMGFRVVPGKLYHLRIQSMGARQADDFVVESVSVESQEAVVSFPEAPVIKTPEPPPPPEGVCPGQRDVSSWNFPSPSLQPKPGRRGYSDSPGLVKIGPGEQASFAVRLLPGGAEDRLGRSLRVHVGGRAAAWVLTLDEAGAVVHANVYRRGEYRQTSFRVPNFRPAAWNQLTVAYCKDGLWHLGVNGAWTEGILPGEDAAVIQLRAEGLDFSVGKRELAQ